jgi:phage regulator Rha-like protein
VRGNHSYKNLREALGWSLNYFMQTRLSFLLIANSYRGKKICH